MALPTTERLVWHGSDNTVKPESVSRGRFFITKIIRFCCTCFLWHLVRFSSHTGFTIWTWSQRLVCGQNALLRLSRGDGHSLLVPLVNHTHHWLPENSDP